MLPQRDDDAEFSSQLMALLNSPVARHCNGLSNLFSPDLNAGSGYGASNLASWARDGRLGSITAATHGTSHGPRLFYQFFAGFSHLHTRHQLLTFIAGLPLLCCLPLRRAGIQRLARQPRLHQAAQLSRAAWLQHQPAAPATASGCAAQLAAAATVARRVAGRLLAAPEPNLPRPVPPGRAAQRQPLCA